MKPVKVKTVQVKAGPMKLASAGGSQPARAADHQRHPCPPRSCRDVQRRCRKGRRRTGSKPPRTRSRASHAAAAGRPRHRKRPAGCAARFQPDAGPIASLACADAGLCRSGTSRPAAGRAAERRRQAGRAGGRGSHRLDRPGRRARKRKRSQAADRSRPQQGQRACSARPIPSPKRLSPRTTARSTAPASPVSSAIRPKRYAVRSSAPTFPA